MGHLASYLARGGDVVTGSDVSEDFFTSPLLSGISVLDEDASLGDCDTLVYSTSLEKRPTRAMREADENGIRKLSYPEMLAHLSRDRITVGVSGTHGKSTTSAIASHLASSASLEAGSVYGSFLQKRPCAYHMGDRGLIIEACEYQDHFLLYDLDVLVITSIDYDHPDYFPSLDDVRRSFRNRVASLKKGATVIYQEKLGRIVRDWKSERPDLVWIPYGSRSAFSLNRNADDSYSVTGCTGSFTTGELSVPILHDHLAGLLATAALSLLMKACAVTEVSLASECSTFIPYLSSFPGLTARGEIVKEEDGITYIDDYAHHPEEMKVCLDNIRRKWPKRRIVCVFMPHTASRTRALLNDFASALSHCDAVFIQSTFAARGDGGDEAVKDLCKALERKVFRSFYSRLSTVMWTPGDRDAASAAASFLQSGDILLTLGAGDNRKLIDTIASMRKYS